MCPSSIVQMFFFSQLLSKGMHMFLLSNQFICIYYCYIPFVGTPTPLTASHFTYARRERTDNRASSAAASVVASVVNILKCTPLRMAHTLILSYRQSMVCFASIIATFVRFIPYSARGCNKRINSISTLHATVYWYVESYVISEGGFPPDATGKPRQHQCVGLRTFSALVCPRLSSRTTRP